MSNCCDCTLITKQDFNGRVDIPDNISAIKLNIAIRETKILIKRYICSELWDELCNQVQDGDLSDENEELLCFIKDIWVRYAFAELLFNHTVSITKENVVRKYTDESENVSFEAVEKQSRHWQMLASNYIEPMKDFLKRNEYINPLYSSNCGGCKDTKNKGVIGFGIA